MTLARPNFVKKKKFETIIQFYRFKKVSEPFDKIFTRNIFFSHFSLSLDRNRNLFVRTFKGVYKNKGLYRFHGLLNFA